MEDYLSREEKLGQLKELRTILNAPLVEIHPDVHGDWLNQRRDDFNRFITVDGKKTDGLAIFENFSYGINTSRDAWSFNANKQTIEHNFKGCIALYNNQVSALEANPNGFIRENDATKIKWNTVLIARLNKMQRVPDYSPYCIP